MIMLSFFWAFLTGSIYIAVRFGGTPEKLGVMMIGGGSLLSALVVSALPIRFDGVEIGVVIVDIALLAGLFALAMVSKRFWPMWATSFHGAGVLTHIAASMSPHSLTNAYALLQGFWAYPMLVTIMIGTHVQNRLAAEGRLPRD
jgi:hypothetical protein